MNIFTCCVCGYLDLDETPYYEDFAGSNVICACCGFEYVLMIMIIQALTMRL